MAETKKVGKNLTEGPILPLLITFAGPLLLANLLQQLYNTADMIVIGQYMGSIGTAGVSNGGEVATVITFISTAFGSAAQIYIAQLAGARDHKSISEAIMTSVVLTAIVSVISTAMVFVCIGIIGVLGMVPTGGSGCCSRILKGERIIGCVKVKGDPAGFDSSGTHQNDAVLRQHSDCRKSPAKAGLFPIYMI